MRVFLVHYDDLEQQKLASELRIWGHEVIAGFTTVSAIEASKPDGVVISLRRMPNHGRQTAHALREQLGIGKLPLVFADGLPDKVADMMDEFHQAKFVAWDELEGALAQLDSTTEEIARSTVPMRLT